MIAAGSLRPSQRREPRAPAAVHAVPVALAPELSGHEALRRTGLAGLDHMRQNEAAVLAGVAEGVHQMRVAARRLRAVLAAFGRLLPKRERRRVSEELRWLADALGPARNLDVFATEILAPARRALGNIPGIAALQTAVERRRKAAHAEAGIAIRSSRYAAVMPQLAAWFAAGGVGDRASPKLDPPVGALAPRIIDRRWRAAKRRAKHFADQSPRARHRLRIALKKLRYAGEALSMLYETDAANGFVKKVKQLQDDLGVANDVMVARDLVAELAIGRRDGAVIVGAGKAVLDWHAQQLAVGEGKLRHRLHRLFDGERFWKADTLGLRAREKQLAEA